MRAIMYDTFYIIKYSNELTTVLIFEPFFWFYELKIQELTLMYGAWLISNQPVYSCSWLRKKTNCSYWIIINLLYLKSQWSFHFWADGKTEESKRQKIYTIIWLMITYFYTIFKLTFIFCHIKHFHC